MGTTSVLRFFQLHRHYGIDLILLSQDYKLICPSITLLAEYQLRAVSDTANPLPGTFMYRKMVGYEEIGKKFLRKKQKVFDLYKTADFDQKKVKKKARPMLILFVVCILLSLFGVYKLTSFKGSFSKDQDTTKNESTFPNKEKKNRFSDFNQNDNNRYGEREMYPQSYLEKLKDLTLLPLDTIEDSTGRYFMFMGTLWPAADLPYKIIKTKLGYCALVPLDIYEYINNQKALLTELTPDHPDNEITSSSESNFKEREPIEQFN